MIAAYQDPEREEELGSPRQYGVTQQHKHLKEMQAVPGLLREPIFCTGCCGLLQRDGGIGAAVPPSFKWKADAGKSA